MLFDRDTGKALPTAIQEKPFDIRMMATRDSRGQLRVNTSPPIVSGEPKEVYNGPGSGTGLNSTNKWEPVGAGDMYNLRSLRVSTGMLGFKGG